MAVSAMCSPSGVQRSAGDATHVHRAREDMSDQGAEAQGANQYEDVEQDAFQLIRSWCRAIFAIGPPAGYQ